MVHADHGSPLLPGAMQDGFNMSLLEFELVPIPPAALLAEAGAAAEKEGSATQADDAASDQDSEAKPAVESAAENAAESAADGADAAAE